MKKVKIALLTVSLALAPLFTVNALAAKGHKNVICTPTACYSCTIKGQNCQKL